MSHRGQALRRKPGLPLPAAEAKSSPLSSPLVLVGIAIVLAMAVAAFALIGGQQPKVAATPSADAGIVAAMVVALPQTELDAIGTGGVGNGLTAINGTPASGRPLVLYTSAEYCPFCAAERWSLVQALGRFGTLTHLSLTTSSSSDQYPDTATFSFRGAGYASPWIDASLIETADREHRPLAAIPSVIGPTIARFDPTQAVPFLYVDGRYSALGANYSPDLLHGLSWTVVAQRLQDPNSPLTRAIVGNANQLAAAICQSTGGQPASVCSTAAVRQVHLPPR